MITKEIKVFNLSEKIKKLPNYPVGEGFYYLEHDIKEFIKILKKRIITGNPHSRQMLIDIDKLAGEKLK